MSSTPLATEKPSETGDRRVYPRRTIEPLVYVDLGPDNGGLFINLSEGGFAFYAFQALGKAQCISFEFTLPGMSNSIQASGQIVWANESGKGGGLRFVDLDEQARRQIREWLSLEVPSGGLDEGILRPHRGMETAQLESSAALAEMPAQDPTSVATDGNAREALQDSSPPPDAIPAAGDIGASVATTPSSTPEEVAQNYTARPLQVEDLLEPEPKEESRPRVLPGWSSEIGRIAIFLGFGCLIVLALVRGMPWIRSELGRIALLLNHTGPVASGQPAPPPTGQRPVAAAGQTFQVEVVDANGRRWVLRYGNDSAAVLGKTPRRQRQESELVPRPQVNKNDVRSWVLHPPRMPQRMSALGDPASERSTAPRESLPPVVANAILPPALSADSPGAVPIPSEASKPSQPQPNLSRPLSNFQGAVLLHQVQPVYPPLAKLQRLEGAVQLYVLVAKDGVPRTLKVVSGNPTLAQAALDAARQWRYKPALLDGEPVEVETNIVVTFHYQQ